jgi:hypothetical protein
VCRGFVADAWKDDGMATPPRSIGYAIEKWGARPHYRGTLLRLGDDEHGTWHGRVETVDRDEFDLHSGATAIPRTWWRRPSVQPPRRSSGPRRAIRPSTASPPPAGSATPGGSATAAEVAGMIDAS